MTIAQTTLAAIREEIAADHPLLNDSLKSQLDAPVPGFSDLFQAAIGGQPLETADYRLALEFIFEGYLLHYGNSRLLVTGPADFHLLAGDYMFARGLESIARLNEAGSVKMFADLVGICSYIWCEELNAALALEVWAVAALSLAAHAGGRESGGRAAGGANRMNSLKDYIWQPDHKGLKTGISAKSFLTEALGLFPDNQQTLFQAMLSDIYSGLAPYNRRQFAV